LRDQGFPTGTPKYPFGQIATMTWITRSWTRPELIDTMAERGRFGFGMRGAAVAARYYFGLALADLSLPQAALLTAFLGEKDVNPWGEPELAAEMRNRILTRMRHNLAIDAATYERAIRAPLELSPEQPPQLPAS
jgi:membrane peptidoglycan carboxypeptidase